MRTSAVWYGLLLPFTVLFIVFVAGPIGWSLLASFTAHDGRPTLSWYAFALRDGLFWLSLANTLAFAATFVALQVPISMTLALLAEASRRAGWWRVIFFSTHAVGAVYAGVLFEAILAPAGPVNRLLMAVGLAASPLRFLESPALARLSVVVVALYLSAGFGMIVCAAALRRVSPELLDAAHLDGCGPICRTWHVKLPQCRPALSFLAIAGAVWALQLFELPFVLLDGPGPQYAGLTAVMYVFSLAFEQGLPQYASAVGWLLTTLISAVVLAGVWLLRVGREDV